MTPPPARDILKSRRARLAVLALAAVLTTGFAMAWNPPTTKVHTFSEASDYDSEKESGCTNSGEGCHGAEATYADFNEYHPNATCTTCHEYQGVGCIPCHTPGKERECALCHDGSKEGVSDRVRLTDSYPRGHYRETTHTAMGTVMDREVRAAEDGKASATCEDCHSRDLRVAHTAVPQVDGSPYGPDIGCGECHNDVRSRGMAEVLSDWKNHACEDCHAVGTSSAMHGAEVAGSVEATGGASCGESGGGCHEGNDLHALHPDAPETCGGSAEDGEPGCHDLDVESHAPTATACGGGAEGACHRQYADATYSHEEDRKVHAPHTDGPASDTSAFGVACGRCHYMDPDGTSLVDEHALPTSERANVPDDPCRDCHNDPASAAAVADDWETRDSQDPCGACHGQEGLDDAHERELDEVHDVATGSEGCADSGAGCHPTSDLSEVGEPTTAGNIHRDCLRCHDRTSSDGNFSYDPTATTCGSGRDCHNAYDPVSPVHDTANGRDRAHRAGSRQADARYTDALTGLATECDACHSMTLGTEHARTNTPLARGGKQCAQCHNADESTAAVVKGSWSRRDSSSACDACHQDGGGRAAHEDVSSSHAGIERGLEGAAQPGACVRSGCHAGTDLRDLHRNFGCTVTGCHSAEGDILGRRLSTCGGLGAATGCHAGYSATTGHKDLDALHDAVERKTDGVPADGTCAKSGCHTTTDVRTVHRGVGCVLSGCHDGTDSPRMSCGGTSSTASCHPGFSVQEHYVDHSADVTGTVGGITYGPGTNEGCFGCHEADLRIEHARERNAGSMDGEAASGCRVCHANEDDPGTGPYARGAAVQAALAAGDMRCIACHATGTADDGPDAVASPHKAESAEDPLPPGKVWVDPLEDWKAAFDAATGGGHNVLSAEAVGSSTDKSFPMTSFNLPARTYTWALPPNSGTTTWLRASVFGEAAVATPASIAEIRIGCDDCHLIPEDAVGPHGSSVRIWIDPEYSQSEYANPTSLAFQFKATGTERVVCFKCHPIQAADDPALVPGGHSMHNRHAVYSHSTFPSDDPRYYGAKCIDCHVRVPHAWKRPRLLVRTVETTDGVLPDEPPYVREGHDGLVGVKLMDFNTSADLRSSSCATGGCYENHTSTRHPEPADIPGAEYWP